MTDRLSSKSFNCVVVRLIARPLEQNPAFIEKILSMYAKGMTTGDIETHIRDIYGIEVSDTTVSRITDKILPIAKEWQQRPLESVYRG